MNIKIIIIVINLVCLLVKRSNKYLKCMIQFLFRRKAIRGNYLKHKLYYISLKNLWSWDFSQILSSTFLFMISIILSMNADILNKQKNPFTKYDHRNHGRWHKVKLMLKLDVFFFKSKMNIKIMGAVYLKNAIIGPKGNFMKSL